MNPFKIGDIVVVKDKKNLTRYLRLRLGETAIATVIYSDLIQIALANGEDLGCWSCLRFKLASDSLIELTQKEIICLKVKQMAYKRKELGYAF